MAAVKSSSAAASWRCRARQVPRATYASANEGLSRISASSSASATPHSPPLMAITATPMEARSAGVGRTAEAAAAGGVMPAVGESVGRSVGRRVSEEEEDDDAVDWTTSPARDGDEGGSTGGAAALDDGTLKEEEEQAEEEVEEEEEVEAA